MVCASKSFAELCMQVSEKAGRLCPSNLDVLCKSAVINPRTACDHTRMQRHYKFWTNLK